MIRVITGWTTVFGLSILLLTPAIARAQADDPAALKLAEPDFTLIGLPTALRLPTFSVAGHTVIRRLTLIGRCERIQTCLYPVFPPDADADDVLRYIGENAAPRRATRESP